MAMGNEEKNTPEATETINTEATVERDKPKLTADEQIERLKARGIAFNLCTESDAKRMLEYESYWFKIAAYRSLYDKQVGGDHVGDYINLDFAYLADLAAIDKCLRQTLLPMTLDVEHYAIAQVERIISEREDEDGYSIVVDYWEGLSDDERKYRTSEIKRLKHDFYYSDLIRRYKDDMPAWVFMELLTFGAFIDFYLFCAKRWENEGMRQDHYVLRAVKSARNAYAHSSCIISNFGRSDGRFRTSNEIMSTLESVGVSKQVRARRMKNAAMQQIAALMYAYSRFVTGKDDVEHAKKSLGNLQSRIDEHKDYYVANNGIVSAFDFLKKVFQILRT